PSALSVPLSIVRAWASRHNQSKFLSASPLGQFSVSASNKLAGSFAAMVTLACSLRWMRQYFSYKT
ncbi:hypothetical protein, partial [Pseudomonas bohemica]|uniref:hypothetical protein n=1 Tax=Pseudomonas bohemica TaxID=2044872 RepID=UPI001F23989A